jgi:DNA-binding MarR family transcriptional regulator
MVFTLKLSHELRDLVKLSGMKGTGRLHRKALAETFDVQVRRMGATNAMFVHAVAARLALNPTDYECLDVLDWTGPITAGQLANQLGLTTGAVSGLLDRLQRSGWVERSPDPNDKRKVIVTLLRTRFAEVAPLYEGTAKAIEGIAASLTVEQLQLLNTALETMNDAYLTESVRIRAEHRAGLPLGPLRPN